MIAQRIARKSYFSSPMSICRRGSLFENAQVSLQFLTAVKKRFQWVIKVKN